MFLLRIQYRVVKSCDRVEVCLQNFLVYDGRTESHEQQFFVK